jgi:energy-coupling factor transporter ATP-binding protein EcfA2
MANNYLKGSEWRKWDLHIHSPETFLANEYDDCGIDQFVQKIVDVDIKAVGLTNYFRFTDKELEEIRGKLNDEGITVFLNLEIRTQPQNKENEEMHIHLLFSDQVSSEKIKNFLGRLKTVDDKYCKNLNQTEIKNTLIAFDSLCERLTEDKDVIRFKDYLLVACPRGDGNFRPSENDDGRGNNLAVTIDKKTDVLFGKEDDREFFLETNRYDGAKPKPVLLCSDAHNLKDIGSAFTWVKADATFEGLKQVMYDPESRIQLNQRTPVQPTNIINSFTFNVPQDAKINIKQKDGPEKEEDFCFAGTEETFHLSPFLNCFIGGRGSGKSTILNLLGQHSKNPDSSSAFWNKIQPSFDTKDESIFTFEGEEIFEFIGQSEVESFATNEEAFTDAIYERANILSDGSLRKNEDELKELLKGISSFQTVIESIKELKAELKEKKKEKKTLNNSIKITKSQEYADIVEKITQKSDQKQQLESWRTTIDGLRDEIDNLQKEHFSPSEEDADTADADAVSEQGEDIVKTYQDAYGEAQENIKSAEEILNEKNFKVLVQKEEGLSKGIEKHEKELSELLEKGGLSKENILQVKSAPQKFVRVKNELANIEKKIKNIENKLNEYDAVLENVEKVKTEYVTVINNSITPLVKALEEQAEENYSEDIKDIGLSYFFDEHQAWEEIADEFYSYFTERHGNGERVDLLKGYITDRKRIFSGDYNGIVECFEEEDKKTSYIEFLTNVFSNELNYHIFKAIRDKHLKDVITHKRIQVLYDGKDIESASFGQKCTAVIVILLLFGNYPLVIDEPEAHLDGSLIANYLVPLIKRKKKNRQIIFATHNANFVVNGDAEKIFVLKNDTGLTKLTETTIENLEHRDKILKLEGGREAFRKRGEKLHI